MSKNKTTPTAESQNIRRTKYTVNVLFAVTLALLLVIFLNWLGADYFKRFDWTATRRYSLSPQTHQLLKQLDQPCEIYTVFPNIDLKENPALADTVAYSEQARDIIDEYGRYGENVTVDHYKSDDEIRIDQLCQTIIERYDEQLVPLRGAIDLASELITEVGQSGDAMGQTLQKIAADPNLGEGELKEMLKQVAGEFQRLKSDIESINKQLTRALDEPLPAYQSLADQLKTNLQAIDQRLGYRIQEFESEARNPATPDSVKEKLLAAAESYKPIKQRASETLASISLVQPIEDYEKIRTTLATEPHTILVLGPSRIRTLTLNEMLSLPDQQNPQPGQPMNLEFHGEEKITGALVSVSLDQSPLVVFVAVEPNSSPLTPNRQGTSFSIVAQRLRNMNFEVIEWFAVPRQQRNPMGQIQPMPPDPMPQPKPDQPVVWIIPPLPPMNPMNPMSGNVGPEVVSKIKQRMKQNDALLITVQPSNSAAMMGPDPIEEILYPYGVTPKLDHVILRQVLTQNNRKQIEAQLIITQWPHDSTITNALKGTPGLFIVPSPITIDREKDPEAQIKTLATADGRQFWAEGNLQGLETGQKIERPQDAPNDPIPLAVSIEKGEQRIVLVSNPLWATDMISNIGALGPGTAALTGSQFPANADLFVNSVYWLSGMDKFIAPSAHAQDIRRIEPMSREKLSSIQWSMILGMPTACALLGLGVWSFRRK